jgi:cyclohexa-1,5-dienecarbonyl-CoA hydratase
VEPDALEDEVKYLVDKLAALSPLVLKKTRKAFTVGLKDSPDDALNDIERVYLDELMTTEDADEGLRSFLEKRKPQWRNK